MLEGNFQESWYSSSPCVLNGGNTPERKKSERVGWSTLVFLYVGGPPTDVGFPVYKDIKQGYL